MIAAVLVVEISVAALVLGWVWVSAASGQWPAPWLILLAAPLALVGGRLVPFQWRRIPWFDAVWWAIVAVAVAILAEVGSLLATDEPSMLRWNVQFVAGLILAWRGWSLAEGWLDLEFVEAEFQLGTLIVLAMLFVLTWAAPGAGLIPAVTFAAAGLFGLGLARRGQRRAPGGPAESDWLVLVGGLVALVVLVAVTVVVLVTPDVLLSIVEQVEIVANLAILGIVGVLEWFSGLFAGGGTLPAQAPATGPLGPGALPPAPPPSRPVGDIPFFWVYEILITFVLVAFLFFAGRAIIRLMKTNLRPFHFRLPKQRETSPALSAAEAFSWRGWWAVLWRWLRGEVLTGQVFSSRESAARRAAQTHNQAAARQSEQRSIRALYREFLSAVSRAGFERQPSTTPNELAQEVNTARPAASRSISTVTELYVRTRYGEEELDRADLSQMREAVQQARRDLTPPDQKR